VLHSVAPSIRRGFEFEVVLELGDSAVSHGDRRVDLHSLVGFPQHQKLIEGVRGCDCIPRIVNHIVA